MANETLTDTGALTPARRKRMSDDELLALLASLERASLGSQVAAGATISTTIYPSNNVMQTLEVDRYNALNAFLARPLGNEIENRSQVVLPVLRDTMSWIMPQLMRIFAGSKSVCRFDPVGPEDEQQAEMETAVVNHIFMAENNGVLVLHDFFWDALVMRNGYVEVSTKETTKVIEDEHKGLDQIELAMLLEDTDDDIEVLEQREYTRDLTLPPPQTPAPILPPGAGLEAVQPQEPRVIARVPVWDLKLRRTQKIKKTRVICLPPEEMRVTPRAREGMEDIAFSQHYSTESRSALISAGYDPDLVNAAAAGRPNWLEIDALARNQVVDQLSVENPSDRAMQEIEVRKSVVMVDYDGDSIAELRRVIVIGDKIAANDVIEETPFVSGEPIRMPHRHTGISVYDLVFDLQVIQTQLWRAGLDNLTVANNLRIAVDWRNVNMDDLLTSRPHGPIRGNGPPAQWIQPIQMPSNLTEQVLPAMDYIDRLRSNRTGVGKGTMGLDADELQNVTKGGQLASMSAASLIVELIARMLAEGVKWIFLKIHAELIRNQDKPLQFEISGKWVTVDPSSWKKRTRVTPTVGLGSGNREELRANIQLLIPAQTQLIQAMMTAPPQVYKRAWETFKVVCEALGFSNPERFGVDPNSDDYKALLAQRQNAPPVPPAPQVQVAQINAATEKSKQQSEDQRQIMKLLSQHISDQRELLADKVTQQRQLTHDATQGHRDREVQIDSNHLQIILKLIPAIAQVLAAEKAAPDELGADVTRAGGQIQ